jgi:Cd(II)/Pb(II)-responsive transcriptional regulator
MDLKIGELARLTGCQAETIRFYEHKGLLPAPARSDNNYRRYDAAHVERLHFIRRCRSLGMSLDEVQVLLGYQDGPDRPCGGVDALVERHIEAIAQRMVELQALHDELSRLRASCDAVRAAGECRILKGLADVALPITSDGVQEKQLM